MDDDEDIHDRLEQLEATVADQQQTIEQLTETPAVGRRSVVASLLGAGAVGGLAGYGSQRSRAASGPAGQVGAGEEPVDGFLWDLDVQNAAELNGNDVTGVGALEALDLTVEENADLPTDVGGFVLSQDNINDLSYHIGDQESVTSTGRETIFDFEDPVDVVYGVVKGEQVDQIYVTWEDGSEDTIGERFIAETENENQFSTQLVPEIEGVKKLEFTNTSSSVYGWEVVTA